MSLSRTQKLMVGTGALCLLALAGVAALFLGPLWSREPVYDGVTLSAWLDQLWPMRIPWIVRNERAVQAVRSIGTNAIPWLLTDLNAGRNRSLNKLERFFIRYRVIPLANPAICQNRAMTGFAALGELGAPAVPELLRIVEEHSSHGPALLSLAYIGKPALPALAQCLTNPIPVQTWNGIVRPLPEATMEALDNAIFSGTLDIRDLAALRPSLKFCATQSTNVSVAVGAADFLERIAKAQRLNGP